MDYKSYLGAWNNCNVHSKGVKTYTFFEEGGTLNVKIEGVATGLIPGAWTSIPCKPYAADIDSKTPIAFQANYSSDSFNAYLQFNVNKSLIILAILIDFQDSEDKSGVFIREFFSME